MSIAAAVPDCQTCGACCAYSAEWPRFTLEEDAHLDAIPPALVAADLSGMRCTGTRCDALQGEIGVVAACSIYALRPQVCHACEPGGDECGQARWAYGLAPP